MLTIYIHAYILNAITFCAYVHFSLMNYSLHLFVNMTGIVLFFRNITRKPDIPRLFTHSRIRWLVLHFFYLAYLLAIMLIRERSTIVTVPI